MRTYSLWKGNAFGAIENNWFMTYSFQTLPALVRKRKSFHWSISFFGQVILTKFSSDPLLNKHQVNKLSHIHLYEFPYKVFDPQPRIHLHWQVAVLLWFIRIWDNSKRTKSQAISLLKLLSLLSSLWLSLPFQIDSKIWNILSKVPNLQCCLHHFH